MFFIYIHTHYYPSYNSPYCFEQEVAKLEKVQLESARIVTGLPKFASRDSLYYETGWEPLSCRRKSRKRTTFYKTTFYKMHNKVLNTCVIVYLLQYLVSVIIISETMKTIQHQEVDSECL